MTRIEFMDSLRRALEGSLTSSTVNENMRYYEEYFDMQIRSGQSEEEVVNSLGDPRLLAKTIIEAAKYQARNYGGDTPEYDEVYEDGSQGGKQAGERGHSSPHVYRLPGWLLIALCVVIFFVVIGIVGTVLSVLLPIAVPVLCVVILVRWLQRRN